MKKLLFSLLTFLLLCFISSKHVNASTEVYKVTDPFHAAPPPVQGVNYVHYYTNISFNYKGGNVLISRNPDGTGSSDIGDLLQIADMGGEFTYLNPNSTRCVLHGPIPPTDISNLLTTHKTYNLLIRLLDTCGQAKDISSIYIVITNIPDPVPVITPTLIPSATPTPTAIPTPTTTTPFLDLPWDYKNKGLTFNDAALAITSYFDHTYPLLSVIPAINEALELKDQITTFMDEKSSDKNYSSHDGYDYASLAKVRIGDPVLAAAPGTAVFTNGCLACGNMIVIDHHNGFETKYLHLQKDGLLTNVLGKSVEVAAHQQIGKMGATGHVIPNDERGAHIHFGVVFDKNHDGNFTNDLPDGMTDPFGWQSAEKDPWSIFQFLYAGVMKIGNISSYLWKTPLDSMKSTVSSTGTSLQVGRFTLNFPAGAVDSDTEIEIRSAPVVKQQNKESIGPRIIATAKDLSGTAVALFKKAFTITVDFANYDLSPFKLQKISLYTSQDGYSWEKQDTVIDMKNKKASAQINHFSQFALMSELKDSTPPSTVAKLEGRNVSDHRCKPDAKLSLKAKDNKKGLGVDYILYNLDDTDWEQYKAPLKVPQSGHHIIKFYAVDKAGNIEDTKSFEFDVSSIDSTGNNNSNADQSNQGT